MDYIIGGIIGNVIFIICYSIYWVVRIGRSNYETRTRKRI